MTLQWAMIIVAVISALSALAGSALAIYFSTGERGAKISNLDADTENKNADTIRTMQQTAQTLRTRVNNLEVEIGKEKALRRKDKEALENEINEERALRREDKVRFDGKISDMQHQHDDELADMQKKHEYEMQLLSYRVKELEDELERSQKAHIDAQIERDESREKMFDVLKDNHDLRQQLADTGD